MKNPLPSLLLFGASRATGFEVAKLARSRGYPVAALSRSFSEPLEQLGVTQHSGDALDGARVAEICHACKDASVLIYTMGSGFESAPGPSVDFAGVVNAVDAARAAGIPRFILLTSLGAGESRAYASERLLAALGTVLEEKTKGEEYLAASGLDYLILRPGRLVDEPVTGNGTLSESPAVHGNISRADLAAVILDCLDRKADTGRVFSAVDRAYLGGSGY
jgi:nucleoside-diphosphate-sugar epimerase